MAAKEVDRGRSRQARLGRAKWAAVQVLLVALLAPSLAAPQDLVAEVEAQFIERFTRFIEWPASSSVPDGSVPFVIGVFGSSGILDSLTRLAGSTNVKGKPLQVRRITTVNEIDSCQVVFVSRSESQRLADILGRTQGKPILTVGDTSGFGRRGVMINFLTEGDFIRFEVNQAAAERSGLRLAEELLTLASSVR